MKMKYLLLLAATALLWTGCKDDKENPPVDEPLRLVDRITWIQHLSTGETEGAVLQFTYDALNRVTKMEQVFEESDPLYGEESMITLSYSSNQVTTVEKHTSGDSETTITSVLTLDAEGRVVRGESEQIEKIDGEPVREPILESWTVTYSDGYAKQIIYEDERSTRTFDFTWGSKNLNTLTYTLQDVGGERSPYTYTSGWGYGSQVNNPACNVDMNILVNGEEFLPFAMLPNHVSLLGFYGKSSGKLMTQSSTYTTVAPAEPDDIYTWVLDSEGYVTKATATSAYEDTTEYTIEYKN